MRNTIVGLLVLILATCSRWCARLHAHDAGLRDDSATSRMLAGNAEAPRPINDDNCACAGALPELKAVQAQWFAYFTPLPLDHPFAMTPGRPGLAWGTAAGPATAALLLRLDRESPPDPRAPSLRC